MIYTSIDGQWHELVATAEGDSLTGCGLHPEFGAEWTRHKPDADLCPDCFPDEQPKATRTKKK